MLVEVNPNYTRSSTGKTTLNTTYLEDVVAIFINILNALPVHTGPIT